MRSTRRSGAAVGLLATALLVAATTCGADSPDQTDASQEASSQPAETTSPVTASATTDAAEPATVTESAAVIVSAPFEAMVDESEYVPARWLVPWGDGFLAVGVRYPPQPLPDELPPEIAELFPPEVVALFPDGLPPTQQEAIDILDEAGLFGSVMDVLDEHPEAMEAVQSAPVPDAELLASWSSDGTNWTPTRLSLPNPVDEVAQVSVSDGRFTIAGSILPTGDDDPWIVAIASTTDLQEWTTASFPVAEPERMSEGASYWVTPSSVAADDEHWVARVMVENSNELWSGAWDDEPTMNDARPGWGTLLATSEGFLDLGSGVAFSPDGTTWTDAPGQAADYRIQGAAPLGDDVLAVTEAGSASSAIVLLDATGAAITGVEVAELDGGFYVGGPMSSPALMVMPASNEAGEQAVPWLLATADAETWILEELSDFEPNLWRTPDVAASNGTIVLVGMYGSEPEADVWQRLTLPG